MAGFYWGMRYYGLRKFLYAGIGLTTVAAFCYPQEAMVIARTSVEHAKRTYEDFKKGIFIVFLLSELNIGWCKKPYFYDLCNFFKNL